MAKKLKKMRSRRPIRVGLTGSLASGKSTVLKAFKKYGFKVLSADEMVAQIYEQKKITKEDVLKKFGKTPAGLKKLERWIHPLVRKQTLATMKKSKKPMVVEVPLLFEARFEKDFDVVVFVHAPFKDRLRRVLKRGMTEKLFRFLDSRQWSPFKKAQKSDYILQNSTKPFLKKQVKHLSKVLLAIE